VAETQILVFAGSIRTGAYSAKLAAVAAKELAVQGASVTHVSLADYPLPIYNADMEKQQGFPENAKKFARLIQSHQGVFIATPEYNHSLPPLLKNTIDWTSRPKLVAEIKLRGRAYGIGSSSDGMIGGARALLDLRKVLATAYGAYVVPEQISISKSGEAYDESGAFVAEAPATLLKTICSKLIDLAQRLAR
jgi:NAD(P)H-dependent FMN reductase